jgi:hypothetical protein
MTRSTTCDTYEAHSSSLSQFSRQRLELKVTPLFCPNRWFEDLDIVWDTIRETARSCAAHKIRRLCNLKLMRLY